MITRKISEKMSKETPITAFQSTDASAPVPNPESLCKKIKREIKLYGFDKALNRWRVVSDYMQTEDWWPSIARKVEETIDTIIEEQELKEQTERERQQESTPSVMILNKSEASVVKQLDQLNGIVEKDAEVTHTKHN